MKTTYSSHWMRIALLCLAALICLLTLSLLAKEILQVAGDPIEPERFDIRPIPVPVPQPPVALAEPPASATPVPSLAAVLAPVAVPVPTPPGLTPQTVSSLAQPSMSGSPMVLTLPVIPQAGRVAIVLTFLILLIRLGLHPVEKLHSPHEECV